jgi:hypothetical protein
LVLEVAEKEDGAEVFVGEEVEVHLRILAQVVDK